MLENRQTAVTRNAILESLYNLEMRILLDIKNNNKSNKAVVELVEGIEKSIEKTDTDFNISIEDQLRQAGQLRAAHQDVQQSLMPYNNFLIMKRKIITALSQDKHIEAADKLRTKMALLNRNASEHFSKFNADFKELKTDERKAEALLSMSNLGLHSDIALHNEIDALNKSITEFNQAKKKKYTCCG